MYYPIVIERGSDTHAWGVIVPDLPGCFSAGDSLEEAIINTNEAVALWISDAIERGEIVPDPLSIEVHHANPEWHNWIWAVVDVDLSRLADKAERINITLPSRLLARVDARARKNGDTRSGFLARAAMNALAHA